MKLYFYTTHKAASRVVARVEAHHSEVPDGPRDRGPLRAGSRVGIEEEEAGDAGVVVEFTDGFGEHVAAEDFFLGEALGFGEVAGVAGGTRVELHDVDHVVAVKEVVPCDGLVEWVRTIANVDAFNGVRDFSNHREELMRQVLWHGGEVASDLDTRVGGFGEWVLPLMGDQGCFDHV